MYGETASYIQINSHVAEPIPIHSSVRQGCPMSMLLLALCVDPLLRILDQKLPGIRIGKRARKTVAAAYAGDITIFVTTPTDVLVKRRYKILRKSHASSTEHNEIEGTGGRMEYIHGYAEHTIPR